ncbi:hypothetical protein BT69DRAFT_1156855 [Atractiella rhizophila]|nr:hypothetical protein BT69DRAFT_1156855 [Atractiella rhizophila]
MQRKTFALLRSCVCPWAQSTCFEPLLLHDDFGFITSRVPLQPYVFSSHDVMAPSSHALRPPPSINPAASHSNPHLSIIPSPTMEARRTLTPQPIQQSSTSPLPPPSTYPAIRFPTSLSRLQRSAPDVVRVRNGSVLSRGMIVKTDFWASGRATFLPLLIRGAPNFRAAEPEQSLGIYRSAQPTVIGLKSILTSLGAGPSKGNMKD